MYKIKYLRWLVVLAVMVYGCSINISPSVPANNPLQPPSSNARPQSKPNGLNLSGRLIYTSGKVGATQRGVSMNLSVQSLDLATGATTAIFNAPAGAWIDAVAVSPDEKVLVISYVPSGENQQSGLYVMPFDGSQAPQLLFDPGSSDNRYYQPRWSPDGKYIYFSHLNYGGVNTTYEVMRMAYPDGQLEKVAVQAYWPNVSEDGTRMTYVTVDSTTGTNKLFVANPDGTQPRQIPISGPWAREIIDAPIFYSADQSMLFSAPTIQGSDAPSLVDKIFGITVAHAHGAVASEWWSVPLVGGEPVQLTQIGLYALFGGFSPDRKYIASYSTDGIFVMKPDGSSLTKVVDYVGGISGAVDWVQ